MAVNKSIREQISDLVQRRLEHSWRLSIANRTVLVAFGAFLAGVCQYTTWPDKFTPSTSQVVGMSATAIVFLFSLISVFVDDDPSKEIKAAHSALAKADDLLDQLEETRRVWPDIERLVSLFQVESLFRDVAESACVGRTSDENRLLETMLDVVKRQLPAAAALSYADPWTICIYRAHERSQDSRYELRLVDHLRAIDCAKGSARVWPEGQGVAGVAFSNQTEILIEDLSADAARAIFKPSGLERTYDDERYRSMVAVPIMIQGDVRPYGIVTATSANVGHFNHVQEDGLKNVDAIRSVARYAALLIAVARGVSSHVATP